MRHVAVPILCLLFAAPALAQDRSTPGALELYPTFQNIGVRLAYTGDADGDATARIEWREQDGPAWRPGMNLTRIDGPRWAGSVLWLTPDTPYEVRVVVEDPDGGGQVSGAARTRTRLPQTAGARTLWVSTTGDDAGPGTLGAPLRSVQAGLNAAQPGDEVRVRPGVYYETVRPPRGGTEQAPIHLVAEGPGVVLDGSDPAFLLRSDWRDDGGGVWSVPFSAAARLVVVDSTMRLFKHATLADLRAGTGGIAQGFALEGGRLHVRPEDGLTPNGRPVHVARFENAIYLDVSHVRVVGLEVRYYGTGGSGAGIYLRGGSRREVLGNVVHSIGGRSILLRVGAAEDLVEGNVCVDHRVSRWPWDAVKGREEELTFISHRGGRGVVIRGNVVRGGFDGISCGGDTGTEDLAADSDVHDNLIQDLGDDGSELEVFAGTNVRFWNNRIADVLAGVSLAPLGKGPCYVLYNVLVDHRRSAFKHSLTSTGMAFVAHNSVASRHAGAAGVWPSGSWSNVAFRNNILTGNGRPAVNDDAGESQTGITFNGDLLSATGGTLFRWKGTAYATLTALRSATGFEALGRSGDPLFMAVSDLRLRAGSPAIDAAIVLPGVNDRFMGAAPDIGFWEYPAAPPDSTPPAPVQDLRAE
jgi:hypothetical protein